MPRLPTLTGALLLALTAHAAASTANGPLLAQACLGCHGPGAAGAGPLPGIAGRPAAQLVQQMHAFRVNERPATIMGRIARGYSDEEIAAVAAYLAAAR
jgi:cytochrome c553